MAEYTKIETARVIICDFCNQLYSDEPCEPADCDWLRMLEENAADVAPVVRCRDCKHFREYITVGTVCTKYVKSLGGREVGLRATGKDDFCNYGERKKR